MIAHFFSVTLYLILQGFDNTEVLFCTKDGAREYIHGAFQVVHIGSLDTGIRPTNSMV
jgi:hypothetical protein